MIDNKKSPPSNKDYIKVNLPSSEKDYISGNGEGVWVKVEKGVWLMHDNDSDGAICEGILDNDSWYFPWLKAGTKIKFETRGEYRPVVPWTWINTRRLLGERVELLEIDKNVAQELYDDVCHELTNYETNEDPETTDEEWCDVFLSLLCRVVNFLDIEVLG